MLGNVQEGECEVVAIWCRDPIVWRDMDNMRALSVVEPNPMPATIDDMLVRDYVLEPPIVAFAWI